MTVPFENLDIHLGQPISLEPSDLFQKVVSGERGGYCFELNGLLVLVLEDVGGCRHETGGPSVVRGGRRAAASSPVVDCQDGHERMDRGR
jgi:arylamine N-acetyltransferase